MEHPARGSTASSCPASDSGSVSISEVRIPLHLSDYPDTADVSSREWSLVYHSLPDSDKTNCSLGPTLAVKLTDSAKSPIVKLSSADLPQRVQPLPFEPCSPISWVRSAPQSQGVAACHQTRDRCHSLRRLVISSEEGGNPGPQR